MRIINSGKRIGLSVIFLVILLINLPSVACYSKDSLITDDVKENIKRRVEQGESVGIVVGVIDSRGTREYFSYGTKTLKKKEPVDEYSFYEIGSISKVFTCTILADMVLRKEVKLEDPVESYLPQEVKIPTRKNKVITFEHLATHSSSLPGMPTNFDPKDEANPYADYTVENMYEFLSGYTLTRDIGEKFEYSNLAMGLLGHTISLKAGMGYEALIKERICNVLKMKDTVITLSPDHKERLAKGHDPNGEVSNWDIPTLAGAGAIRSTASDLLTFLAANMGIKKTELTEAMEMTHAGRVEAGKSMIVGLGWINQDNGNTKIIWHNGGTGGYRSFCGFIKDQNIGVVVLSNMNIRAQDIGFHILDSSYPLKDIKEKTEQN
ncbi:serine hydrolase domain-containing protein [Acidobacteriota bacterium]